MTALAALIRRDIKIALRVGGGALIGVLFFLTVTVLMPFAIAARLAAGTWGRSWSIFERPIVATSAQWVINEAIFTEISLTVPRAIPVMPSKQSS